MPRRCCTRATSPCLQLAVVARCAGRRNSCAHACRSSLSPRVRRCGFTRRPTPGTWPRKTDTRHVAQTSIRRIRPVAGEQRPLELVQTYLRLSGHTEGWLFRSISGGGKFAVSNKRPVSQTSLNELVKDSAQRLGFDPRDFGTHSLKHGFADDGKLAGVPNRVLKAAGGWKSDRAFHGYGGEAARQRARRLEREERAAETERDREGLHKAVWAVGSAPPAAPKTVGGSPVGASQRGPGCDRLSPPPPLFCTVARKVRWGLP